MKKIKSILPSIIGFLAIALVYLFVTSIGLGDETTDFVNVESTIETIAPTSEASNLEEASSTDEQITYERGNTYQAYVVRVVDGDTIVAEVNGEQIKVRLSGIDTPESVGDYKDNPEFYGKEASAYAEELLDGKTIWLEEDVKPKDKYDRYLLYVWLKDPLTTELLDGCVNAILLQEGYAQWFNDYENRAYAEDFEAYETRARSEGRGLWQEK